MLQAWPITTPRRIYWEIFHLARPTQFFQDQDYNEKRKHPFLLQPWSWRRLQSSSLQCNLGILFIRPYAARTHSPLPRGWRGVSEFRCEHWIGSRRGIRIVLNNWISKVIRSAYIWRCYWIIGAILLGDSRIIGLDCSCTSWNVD